MKPLKEGIEALLIAPSTKMDTELLLNVYMLNEGIKCSNTFFLTYEIFVYETFLKPIKLDGMHCSMFKITSAPVAINGKLCNLIIYYVTKPPKLDRAWSVGPN